MAEKLSSGPKAGYDLARTGSGLSRGPNLKKKTVPAAWSNTWPAPGATLDLDFANNRGFVRGVGQGGAMDAVTFTRASNATYVNEQGLLVTHANQGALGNNLLTFPQDFENAYWTKFNSTFSPKVLTSPNGTLSAGKLAANTGTGADRVIARDVVTILNGASYTFSVYARQIEKRYLVIQLNNSSAVSFITVDLSNGTAGTFQVLGGGGLSSPSISVDSSIAAETGWHRVAVTFTSVATFVNTYFGISDSQNSRTVTGNGFDGIGIWGAQLELGSTATTYYPTNIGQPRFDWASTAVVANKNLFTRSENISGWDRVLATVTWTNNLPDPDGGNTATRLTPPNSVDGVIYFAANHQPNTQYTFSIWLRGLVGGEIVRLFFQNGGSINVNLTTSWQKFVHTNTPTGSGWVGFGTGAVYTGQAYSFEIWHPQLELGATATDYQPISYTTTTTPLAPAPTCNGLLIEESRTNRLLWCRDATKTAVLSSGAASWGPSNVTYTSTTETTDPAGGAGAYKMVESTTSSAHTIGLTYPSFSTVVPVTFSVYAKLVPGSSRYLQLSHAGGANYVANFDLSRGVVTYTSGSTLSASITPAGDGWFFCSIVCQPVAATGYPYIWLQQSSTAPYATTYTGDGTSGVYIFNPTTSYYWAFSNLTAAKTEVGVDGISNAATLLTATGAQAVCFQTVILASGSRTSSVYLKRITGTGTVQVSLDGSTWSTVELSTSEWRRVVLSGTVTNPVVGVRIAVSGDAVAMDYGQVEDGAFATSPVLTTGATATRAAETTSLFNQQLFSQARSGGTCYCKATYANTPNQGGFLVVSDGGSANRLWLSKGNFSGPNSLDCAVVTNNTFNYATSAIPTSIKSNQLIEAGNEWRTAISYNRNSLVFGFNGFVGVTYTLLASGYNVPSTLDRMTIGTATAGGSSSMTGWISRIVYTPTSVTQVGLQELTR